MIDFFPQFRKSMKDSLDRNLLKTQIFKKLDKKLPIINGESEISLRLIDWFVTNYAKKNFLGSINNIFN